VKKVAIIGLAVAALAGIAWRAGVFGGSDPPGNGAQAQGGGQGGGRGGDFGRGNFGGGGGGRGRGRNAGPMTVEVVTVKKGSVAQQLTGVGNLVGDATVAVVPRAAGRLESVTVRLGDRVSRGERIAKIEDNEIQEQVRQAMAAQEVSQATIRQREADLKLAETNLERSRNLFARQLLPKQTLDDTEARHQAAVAQLDLARAQSTQSNARLDELKITLANTNIISPVNGFVARRAVDPGAFVGNNAPVVDVVDITRVRLVVNVIEKDLSQLQAGDQTRVEVDAFPGETFTGRIARVAPVLDPATRTAPIEIEIPNGDFRLKPGMYARISITTNERKDTLVVPANAVVDYSGRRGVFLATQDSMVQFRNVRLGIEEDTQIEVLDGLEEGDRVVTTGAAALTDGATVIIAGGGGGDGRSDRPGRRAMGGGTGGERGAEGRRGGRRGALSDQNGQLTGERGQFPGGRRGDLAGRRGGRRGEGAAQ
jgi:HlyD family secretion protein